MGDKSKGWILLYRSIRDSWVWDSRPFDQARAWIDLILDANHDEGKVFTGTNLIKVKRGQDLISIRSLASRWGWSKDRVSNFLSALQSDNMIKLEKVSGRTVLTIVNYGFFQNRPDTNKDTYRTPTRTRSGRKPVRNKEGLKEELKERKERDLPSEGENATEDDGWFEALEDDRDTTEHKH